MTSIGLKRRSQQLPKVGLAVIAILILYAAHRYYSSYKKLRQQYKERHANDVKSGNTVDGRRLKPDEGKPENKLLNWHSEIIEMDKGKPGVELSNRQSKISKTKQEQTGGELLEHLGVLASRNGSGWFPVNCDRGIHLRQVSIPAFEGNLTFYVYNSASDDGSGTARALSGWYFEKGEIGKFLNVSRDLPLIDVGANLGLVALQAAKQGRQVVALEPIPENALRLCRSVLDFGHARLVQVIQNAVSSEEGKVTLAMPHPKRRTLYEVVKNGRGHEATSVHSIWLDRVLDVLPFKVAALKIDVEGHEGHVLAVADKLFQKVDIRLVWLEWEHVKKKQDYGGAYVIQFMKRHHMVPYDIMSGQRLSFDSFQNWPFSVLWRREKTA